MQTPTPTANETLYGGKAMTVILKRTAPDAPVTTEQVFVRQLDFDHYPALLEALEDERKQIELYCDKPAGWARTLSVESHTAVIEEGDRINGDFFAAWLRRRMSQQERIKPGITEKMMIAGMEKYLAQQLPNGLPTHARTQA